MRLATGETGADATGSPPPAGAAMPSDLSVVFLNPSGQLGGAERSLLDIMSGLLLRYPEWRLSLIVTAPGPLVHHARALGVETVVLSLPMQISRLGDAGLAARGLVGRYLQLLLAFPAAAAYAVRLRRALTRLGADLIHTNGFKMHVLGSWVRPRATPLVWHIHDFVKRRQVMSRLLRLHSRRCTIVMANSRSVQKDVVAALGGSVPARLVYNAVDLDRFAPVGPKLDLDELAGVEPPPEGTVRVGLVATLGWWKGHETFLRALALLPRTLPVRGYVVGGALYETRGSQHTVEGLKGAAKRFGVTQRVAFTGFVEDAAAAIRSLDVLVHASTEPEAFGLVIIEGMSAARAVIASNSGGAAELVTEGVNGLLHMPGNEFELAKRIERLVLDADLRARLGAAGRQTVVARFSPARLVDDIVPVYAEAWRRAGVR